ncbi:glycine cleavage system protein GcvH [Candidatus Woesearchaeota archaeon]|nr:glycine cleavage system protein GcvH [Candidatus Woesearchaeota archaeon]
MLFTKEHEWVELDGDGTGTTGRIGITQYAVDQLGEIVYLDLAAPGTPLAQGKRLGEVESVKSVSDIFSPVSGLVTAINQAVVDHPELVNKEPYGQGWLVKASDIRHDELTGLMTHSQYQSYLAGQAHH